MQWCDAIVRATTRVDDELLERFKVLAMSF
jgi:hypothetical protein